MGGEVDGAVATCIGDASFPEGDRFGFVGGVVGQEGFGVGA
ncbi:MAG: hypothetical protein R2873_01210 [Caldilineaceae bacterium]